MNTDQLRDEYEPTMNSEQLSLLGYWAECGLRGEKPVSISAQDLTSSWENQQMMDLIKGGEPAFKTQQDYHRDMLTRLIQAHIDSWEGREKAQKKLTDVPDIGKKISGYDICKHTDFRQYRPSPDQPD